VARGSGDWPNRGEKTTGGVLALEETGQPFFFFHGGHKTGGKKSRGLAPKTLMRVGRKLFLQKGVSGGKNPGGYFWENVFPPNPGGCNGGKNTTIVLWHNTREVFLRQSRGKIWGEGINI